MSCLQARSGKWCRNGTHVFHTRLSNSDTMPRISSRNDEGIRNAGESCQQLCKEHLSDISVACVISQHLEEHFSVIAVAFVASYVTYVISFVTSCVLHMLGHWCSRSMFVLNGVRNGSQCFGLYHWLLEDLAHSCSNLFPFCRIGGFHGHVNFSVSLALLRVRWGKARTFLMCSLCLGLWKRECFFLGGKVLRKVLSHLE